MTIRRFRKKDAEFCFKIRADAFIRKFYGELGAEAVAACVNAYMPEDYVCLAEESEFFLIEEKGRRIGFFTVKRIDEVTAEIPLIYLDLNHLGKGVGRDCIQFIEEWVLSNWKEVIKLIVDTIIPVYNGGFYEKAGFSPVGETFCDFPGLRVKALRFVKELKH